MKKIYLMGLVCMGTTVFAQTFSDNFDSYSTTQKLAQQSGGEWTTWSNTPGGAEDATVTSTKSSSAPNSVYFASAVQGGGPTDLVRNFGVLNTGQFTMSMKMFVPAGKAAYFNFQRNAIIGQVWALSANFNDDGTLGLDSYLSTTYPQDVWFTFRIDINFNTNKWELFIDGVSKGSFLNNENQIASIDIFPVDQNTPYDSEFWVDDFEYTVTPYTLPTLNAGATGLNYTGSNLVGSMVTPSVKVRNLGTTAITELNLEVSYNGNVQNQTFSGLNLASLAEGTYTFNNAVALVSGSNNMTARIISVNGQSPDGDVNDNQLTLVVNPIVPAFGKVVVGEEGTGTWCGWCPRGAVFMDKFADMYGVYFAGIAVHNNDTMTVAEYDGGMGNLINGYPSALVDRGADVDPSGMEPDILSRILVEPDGVFENAARFDAATRVLSINSRTTFLKAINASNYKLICVLTEDNVTGTSPEFDQSNYYAGGGNGPMGGYENLPGTVPAAQMVYNHVARAIAPSFGGQAGVYPAATTVGQEVQYDFSFTLPADWNTDDIHIITMLVNPDGTINNAGSSKFNDALLVGMEEKAKDEVQIKLFPNPAHDKITFMMMNDEISSLSVIAADGREVFKGTVHQANGFIPVEQLSNGVYTIRFVTAKGVIGSRIFIKE